MLNQINYNPDVLDCLANLSNEEVFTSPELANEILDLLPQELFQNKKSTFLDPVTKTGVFLREIAKRLMDGLKDEIPDTKERVDHILKNQIFGMAITNLTSLLARRSLYCSKKANGKYSICESFETEQGNILFSRIEHTWKNGKCEYCGANETSYDRGEELETYAYQFIHTENPEEIFNMKFDVILGNPPYQMSDGGGGGSAMPIYHKFINTAKKLNPRYLSMIIPSRWFAGGRGLNNFRDEMLNDKRISKVFDFPNSSDCFPSVEIKGGVCYFLWEKDYSGDCEITNINKNKRNTIKRPLVENQLNFFIRYNQSISIVRKVLKLDENKIDSLISPMKPFGFRTFFKGKLKNKNDSIKIFHNGGEGYVSLDEIKVNKEIIDKHKVFITRGYGAGESFPHQILNKPFYGEPGSVCTETYIYIGPFKSKKICESVISYIQTKFFRFLVLMIKNTQDAPRSVYRLVPIQDFSELWTDEQLYKKYDLNEKEIEFIESMVRPMELK